MNSFRLAIFFAAAIGLTLASASWGQDLSISEDLKARILKYAEDTPREAGTKPEDWRYTLPEGITRYGFGTWQASAATSS